MNLKFIFKVLSFSLATSFVFAAEKNNCNEIENYLKKKSLDYKENIEKCVTNSQGKVEELIVRNYALQKEDVKQILSYNSIKNLTYAVEFKFGEEQDSLYSNPFLPHPGYIKFPSVIADLPELEHLNFEYDHFRRIKYTPEVEVIKIENEYLKLSKKLKTLTLSEVKLTKENLVELSKLSNLEELLIHDAMGNEKYFPNHIEKLKSLKQLYLENSHCKGTSYNFNGLDNLELFYFKISSACDIDLSKLNKLSELNLSHLTLTSNNYKEIFSLSHLEELIIYCFGNSDKIDIKSLKNPDKLRKFNLKENNLLKIPEAIPTLKNIEYINLDSNIIYGRLPESLNKLEKLKYFNINENKNIIGKVLTNKNIEECYYSSYYDLCVPKDSKVNYSTSQIENEKTPFKTCEDEKVIEEIIYRQMIKLGEDITYVVCSANKQGKAKDFELHYKSMKIVSKKIKYLKNLENINFESCEIEDLPNEFGELENLKSLILYDNELTKLPEVIAKLKNLEYLINEKQKETTELKGISLITIEKWFEDINTLIEE
ncbi:L domain-like protein [Neocallimastix lanati (nom. inval.)]|uniref:L domain-like protein n=1 Tax=Neocallimastix californiae TaxID=1754190 RepID=A0A1Y2EUU0_9FUNG|nr:L domain-like protein [Neocallimastix sp. JGI-2020a]ORY74926.1 L domain-like protein [Neocallimastix californiae]|eukprot:ORY74926.1 L domain-like protein [Neocallimastix californiae]